MRNSASTIRAMASPSQGRLHPKGMESFSPGLRGTSYPGCPRHMVINPARVVSMLSMNRHAPIYGAEEGQDERAATLSGLTGVVVRLTQGSSFLATLIGVPKLFTVG